MASGLDIASSSGHMAVVELLVDKEADINARGGRYGCALQAASCSDRKSMVQLF